MERRLGRGLETLLGMGSSGKQEPAQGPAQSLPIDEVRPNPDQPRKLFDSAHMEELKESILQHGILQPICVRRVQEGYQIVAGERRWRAARLAGMGEIPAVVLESVDDRQLLELALVENLQREDLDAIEKAKAFQQLVGGLGLTQEQVAARVGLKRATVANHLRLLELPGEVQEAVAAGMLSMGHARALLGLEDPKAVRKLMARAVREELSVRQVEQIVRSKSGTGKEPTQVSAGRKGSSTQAWTQDMEGRLRRALGTKVQLHNRAGYTGQVVIQYHDREELDRICDRLAPPDRV